MEVEREMIALGVRQPWVELILRGEKTIEVRSQNTNVRGTIYLYASKKVSAHPAANKSAKRHDIVPDELPLGVLVGTVDIVDCIPCKPRDAKAACVSSGDVKGQYGWRLENACRFPEPVNVVFLPYGVWFYPFKRRPKMTE